MFSFTGVSAPVPIVLLITGDRSKLGLLGNENDKRGLWVALVLTDFDIDDLI